MRSILLFIYVSISLTVFSQQQHKVLEFSIEKSAIKKIILPGSPDFLAADGDDVWVLNIDRVEKLAADKNEPVLSVHIPDACGGLIVGFNSLWVASCREQSVYRVDKISGKILAKILCGVADSQGEISLAISDSAVWILSDRTGILTKIDPETNTIQAKISVLPNSYCAVSDYHAVWVSNSDSNSVQRIDVATDKVIATIKVGKTPRFIAAGEHGVWTLNQGDGTVTHIDPEKNQAVAVIDTKVPGTGGDIATGGGLVWVRAKTPYLLQTINPGTNAVETIYHPVSGSGAVRVTDHFIWVTAHDINTIWILKR